MPIVTDMRAELSSHWQRLGDLLVEQGVVDPGDLDFALAVQRRTGALLGAVLVSRDFVSAADLASALAAQHGLRAKVAAEQRERLLRVPPPPTRSGGTPWKPLGRVLVERGLLTEGGLERALVHQRQSGRLLGEIVVSRGWVSPEDLTRAIAGQHGVELEQEVEAEALQQTSVSEAFEIHVDGAGPVHTSATFLDAADLAFELIEQDDPDAIAIVRVAEEEREQVWSYSRARAEEQQKDSGVGPSATPSQPGTRVASSRVAATAPGSSGSPDPLRPEVARLRGRHEPERVRSAYAVVRQEEAPVETRRLAEAS